MNSHSAQRKFLVGALCALGAAVSFGLSTPIAKVLLSELSPILLAGLLYFGSGMLLFLSSLILRRKFSLRIGNGKIIWLVLAIIFGGVLGPALLLYGLARSSAATSSLLLNFEGVFTAVLAWLVFKEKFNSRIGVGMALIAAGGVFLSWQGSPEFSSLEGPLCVVAACFAWGLDNNFTRKISEGDPIYIAAIKGTSAGASNLVLAFLLGSQLPSLVLISQSALLGFFSYGLSLALFVVALRNIGSARTGAYFSTAPFIGAFVALFLGEPISFGFVVAAALMGVGVWLHLTEKPVAIL